MRRPKLTRLGFFKASAAAGVAGAAVGILAGCSHDNKDQVSDPVVVDSDSAVSVTADGSPYEYEDNHGFTLEGTWTLPLGCVLRPAEGTWVPATVAGSSALPAVKGGPSRRARARCRRSSRPRRAPPRRP